MIKEDSVVLIRKEFKPDKAIAKAVIKIVEAITSTAHTNTCQECNKKFKS